VGALTESLEVQQGQVVTVLRRCACWLSAVIRPAHGKRRMRAIAQADDKVRIHAPADADDLTLLAIERVIGMGDGHRFQRRLGNIGSVLRGSPRWRIGCCNGQLHGL